MTLLPFLNPGTFVFVTSSDSAIAKTSSILIFKELEGYTHIINSHQNKEKYNDLEKWAWITLNYQSELNEIGITAKFSNALSMEKIPCNVVAGFYHDHIFVPYNDRHKAIELIEKITI